MRKTWKLPGGEGLLFAVEGEAVPKGVVKGLGGEVDDVGVGDHVCAELVVEGVGGGLADVGEVGDEAMGRGG